MSITVQLKPWGNSQGIRISREILRMIGADQNSELEMDVKGDFIILRKPVQRKTLPEYAAAFGGKLGPYEEFDWGDGIGIERWLDANN